MCGIFARPKLGGRGTPAGGDAGARAQPTRLRLRLLWAGGSYFLDVSAFFEHF